eukprot:COSAG02_NODE_8407_length_2583_cov_2.408615_3_plen_192_part_00
MDVQALMAEVDRLGIDNRRLIRQVEQLMGTQDVAATIEPKSQGGATTPRGSRRGKPAQQEEDPGIGRIEHEVAKLHNVIAEMAEREERLLRMLQLPDVKPDPGPIKKGDFVRKNRALVHHTSSFNSLLRQLRKEVMDKPSFVGSRTALSISTQAQCLRCTVTSQRSGCAWVYMHDVVLVCRRWRRMIRRCL